MALSYNPKTRVTAGFCGYSSQHGENDAMIRELKQVRSNAYHPMLLPALIYGRFWDELRWQMKDVRVAMQDIQDKTGLLKGYLKLQHNSPAVSESHRQKGKTGRPRTTKTRSDGPDHGGKKDQTYYDLLHKRLVEQQARMTNGLADFVSDLGPACEKTLSTIREQTSSPDDSESSIEDDDLQTYVRHIGAAAKVEHQYRDQLLSRVDMQLQVVCNFFSPGCLNVQSSILMCMLNLAL